MRFTGRAFGGLFLRDPQFNSRASLGLTLETLSLLVSEFNTRESSLGLEFLTPDTLSPDSQFNPREPFLGLDCLESLSLINGLMVNLSKTGYMVHFEWY